MGTSGSRPPCRMLLAVPFVLALFVGWPKAAAAAEGVRLTAHEAVTTIAFKTEWLALAGLEVRAPQTTAELGRAHPLSVAPRERTLSFRAPSPWALELEAPDGHLEGYASGQLRHLGGFELVWAGGTVDMTDFVLRPGAEPRTFELLTPGGEVLFVGDHVHHDLDLAARRLWVFNVDLRLSAGFAARLGDPRLEGLAMGLLSVDAEVAVPEGYVAAEGGPPGCSDWSGDQDVQLIAMSSVQQVARSGGRVVIAPSATLKNVGTANVPWFSKFSGTFPPYGNDQHPFLVWNLYRMEDGRFEQLGRSWVKHAFLTINSNCAPGACTDGHILGIGCEDVYGVGTNSSNSSLGPRPEITASTGIWAHCDEPEPNTPSYFDQDGNCVQDFYGTGQFDQGLVVDESELAVAGAIYTFSSWYVIRDDVDIFNTMGWRRIVPSFSGSGWLFSMPAALVNGSPLDAWVDPAAAGPAARNVSLSTADGHLQLGVTAQPAAAGLTRFEYALMNHDFDRRVSSFSVPLPPGAAVSATGFHDFDGDPATDWVAVVGTDAVTWTAPTADVALDWGLTASFTLVVDGEPGEVTATLGVLEPGPVMSLDAATLGPGGSGLIFADGFESGDSLAWSGSVS